MSGFALEFVEWISETWPQTPKHPADDQFGDSAVWYRPRRGGRAL